MKSKITTIINYCTNDYRFLQFCIDAVKPISHEIIIPVCDHFFNGEKENRYLLNRSYMEHPDCKFIEYSFPKEKPYGKNPPIGIEDENFKHYMHSTSRYLGYLNSSSETDLVLYLDVDEIMDTNRFIEWFNHFDFSKNQALRFFSYFYFRSASYRAKSSLPVNALLLKKSAIKDPEIILSIGERYGLYIQLESYDTPYLMGLDGHPLFHHYSYVRTMDEMKKKVTTWGHAHEKNWVEQIHDEFSHDFMMIDMIFYHLYEKITPPHDPFSVVVPTDQIPFEEKKPLANVRYIQQRELANSFFSA
jgi:hypothetical protein